MSQELKILQKVNRSKLVKLDGFCISSEGKSYLSMSMQIMTLLMPGYMVLNLFRTKLLLLI